MKSANMQVDQIHHQLQNVAFRWANQFWQIYFPLTEGDLHV